MIVHEQYALYERRKICWLYYIIFFFSVPRFTRGIKTAVYYYNNIDSDGLREKKKQRD